MQPGWKPRVRASLVTGWLRLSEMTWAAKGMVGYDSQVGTPCAEMFPSSVFAG